MSQTSTPTSPIWEFAEPNSTQNIIFYTLQSSLNYWILPLIVVLGAYVCEAAATHQAVSKTEGTLLLGKWSKWMPRLLHNAIYAAAMRASERPAKLTYALEKFQKKAFQLIRNDGNIVVLPKSLLEQLSSLPGEVASPHGALEHDLLGPHTGLNLILESRLHHSIVQRKLTPRLPLLAPRLEEELNAAVAEYFPRSQKGGELEWTMFQPYQVLAKVSARLAARVLVGPELCRNEVWLDVSINYTENLFRTIVILRLFPAWTHIILRYFLPSYWNGLRYVRVAKALLSPIIQELLDKNDRGKWSPASDDKESNVLCWLIDVAKGRDRNAETLAHVEVLLALASVHTTLLRMVNVLYDITPRPELLSELRQEIDQTRNAERGSWTHACYAQLEKLDSVLRESQRMSPPTILGLKRLFKESFTFQDGTHIPKGSYATLPIYAIENDPRVTPNPSVFDGLRSYRRRSLQRQTQDQFQTAGNDPKTKEYSFSWIEPTILNFGYGKSACPGRYFASLIIKMVFVKLLSEYDFRFKEGEGRPQNLLAHEFLFCWPWQKMEVRKNHQQSCPF